LATCQHWYVDDPIIAQWGECFQGHVAGALRRPFVVLFEQDGADDAGDLRKVPTNSARRLISPWDAPADWWSGFTPPL
jgi:hypothetical protein